MKCVQITVFGRVQGVGFRYSTLNKANNLRVSGYVKNQSNRTVLIEAEGDEAAIDLLIEWCKKSPSWSRVSNVVVAPSAIRNYQRFTIK